MTDLPSLLFNSPIQTHRTLLRGIQLNPFLFKKRIACALRLQAFPDFFFSPRLQEKPHDPNIFPPLFLSLPAGPSLKEYPDPPPRFTPSCRDCGGPATRILL